jgi:predicted dehydrogenase
LRSPEVFISIEASKTKNVIMIIFDDSNTEYLDYSPSTDDGDFIDIDFVINVFPVKNLYFERGNSFRLVWNYVLDIGLKNTLIKILSRRAERQRNKKYFLIGSGVRKAGGRVNFIAPKHPFSPSRIWLPSKLFIDLENSTCPAHYTIAKTNYERIAQLYESLAGWDTYSGDEIPKIDWEKVQDIIEGASPLAELPLSNKAIRCSSRSIPKGNAHDYTATLFGLGNYAKTIVIPSLPGSIKINRIHEVDPLQIPKDDAILWDTSPTLSKQDSNKIVFIAGYHHTHNQIACEALQSGKVVVVEKPLVVDRPQLASLERSYGTKDARYYACFHKRYSPFNSFAIDDLDASKHQSAINYHCIVYEVPLPEKHWYRWENSSTRIISNGCHWIDHFLYLNDFSEPKTIRCDEASDGTVSIFIELKNHACFTMTLTDIGSERIGMQDYIELRRNGITIKITNGSHYISEAKDRVLRKKSINKISSYRNMYSSIGKAILRNEPGDPWEHNRVSCETVLNVNELVIANTKIK